MEHSLLLDLTILFGAAVVVSYVFHTARLSTIAGFLVAGTAIGPSGLGLIASTDAVRQIEEIGIILLLFAIGVEFSPDKLRKGWWVIAAGGGAQVGITGVVSGAATAWLTGSIRIGVLAGMLVALSSTVIGLRLLQERHQMMAPQGTIALAILIFQDIAVLPMMLFLPFVTGRAPVDPANLVGTLALSAGAIAVIVGAARILVPKLIERTVKVRSRDIFILSVMVIVLGTAGFSASLGVSAGLGAFIAGLVISESEYSHQVLSDVLPFRETFTSLFFVSIGMLLDPAFLLANAVTILGLALGIVLGKAVIAGGVVRLLGYPARVSVAVGLLLSQVGEFSIVLLQTAQSDAVLSDTQHQTVLAVILVTMVLSTFVQKAAEWIPPGRVTRSDADASSRELAGISGHTVIVGFGLNGQNVAGMLRASSLPFTVLEMNPRTVGRVRETGIPIQYGDAASETVLDWIGVGRARAVVFAISDPGATRQGVAAARRLNPGAYIIARTRYESEIEPLYRAGADTVVTEEFETSLTIIRRLLDRLGIHPSRIDRAILEIRQEHYQPLLTSDVRGIEARDSFRMFEAAVRDVASGRSIAELRVRRESGATIVAIERDGEVIPNPPPEFVLRAGDRAHLIGSEQEVARAATLI